MAEKDGIEKARSVFERALIAVGLNVAKGSVIWEAYREFENAIHQGLQVYCGYSYLFINPLTTGPEYIRFLHVLLAYYIPAIKHVKDKKWHKSGRFGKS